MTTQPKRRRRTPAEMKKARRRREAARKANLKARHNMTVEQYDSLLEYQRGVCYICRRAKGKTRALQVDHDHAIASDACSHDKEQSCERCWRGLLCARCNGMLAHARDEIQVFRRAIRYLVYPPASGWWLKQ
jgi:Recombination endonuclease VII